MKADEARKQYNRLDLSCRKALAAYGEEDQMWMVVEEQGELIQAVSKYRRSGHSAESKKHIIEEMADVYIMLKQLELIINAKPEDIDNMVIAKLGRLEYRLAVKEAVEDEI